MTNKIDGMHRMSKMVDRLWLRRCRGRRAIAILVSIMLILCILFGLRLTTRTTMPLPWGGRR